MGYDRKGAISKVGLKLSGKKVLIVGLARDCEKTLLKEILRLQNIFLELFEQVDFYIVESDSSDGTVATLTECSRVINGFNFQSLGKLQRMVPDRIERLRVCRNNYIEYIFSSKTQYDFVVMNDFDIKNRKLKAKNLRAIFSEKIEWSAFFANQAGRYYDIYALRHPQWNKRDCFIEANELRLQGIKNFQQEALWAKMKKIPVSNDPIQVESAFGGLAIYKTQDLKGLDYSLYSGVSPLESEHISLNYKLINNGLKLHIHPRLINFSWNPHNLSSFKLFRAIDRHSKVGILRGIRRILRSAIS
jgi:hypothetical protein